MCSVFWVSFIFLESHSLFLLFCPNCPCGRTLCSQVSARSRQGERVIVFFIGPLPRAPPGARVWTQDSSHTNHLAPRFWRTLNKHQKSFQNSFWVSPEDAMNACSQADVRTLKDIIIWQKVFMITTDPMAELRAQSLEGHRRQDVFSKALYV